MFKRKLTKSPFAALAAAALAVWMAVGALAAGGDITALLLESLQTDTASIALYEPTESFSLCGEILYSDETGAMQLAVDGQEAVALESVTVSTAATYTPPQPTEDDSWETDSESWDGETPYVTDGYVLVTLRAAGMDEYTACLDEKYTLSPSERAERRETETTEPEAQPEAPNGEETADASAAVPVQNRPESETISAAPEKATLADRIAELSDRELVLLIAVMVLGVGVLAELLFLVVYKRRAENVAKNYLRARTALDESKRELSAARTKNLRLERELLQERDKMNAVRGELEKMQGKRPKKKAEPTPPPPTAPEKKSKTGYDLDYLNWTL